MEKKKIIANWKSNKSAEETIVFLDALKQVLPSVNLENKEIVILPSFLSIPAAATFLETERLPISIGAQDISANEQGAYTGSVNGLQIAEFCKYVLINHSERRRYNHETDQDVRAKVIQAQRYNLIPLFCIQSEQSAIPDFVTEIMYEPPSAISTFQEGAHAEDGAEIEQVFMSLSQRFQNANFYYGGSVTPSNIENLLQVPKIAGFLIGGASLDIEQFAEILMAW